MSWKLLYLSLILLSASLTLFEGVEVKTSQEAAAECLAVGENCTDTWTLVAKNCVAGLPVKDQPGLCLRDGCAYCEEEDNMLRLECQRWPIRSWCPFRKASADEAAARCLSLGEKCGGWLTSVAKYCAAGVLGSQQPDKCIQAACTFCGKKGNGYTGCKSWPVEQWCSPGTPWMTYEPSSAPPMPTEEETPKSHFFPRSCIHQADSGRVVISMADVPLTGRWTRAALGGGLTWRADDNRTWVSPPGTGEMCFAIRFKRGGRYFITALTSAPDKREHNDMWLLFSGGMQFYNAGSFQPFPVEFRSPNSYYKVYQNIGENRRTKVISTINGQPHILISHAVDPIHTYTLCISGRSSMFTVYSLFMIRCRGDNCRRTSQYIKRSLRNNTATPCVEDM